MKYFDELKRAMVMLAEHEKTIFIGQAVAYGGTGMYDTLVDVPDNKKVEFPVAEYLQCGVVNGLAIQGWIPVSIIPRWNFLLMGTDQIINHLDKLPLMSDGRCTPKAIIRVAVGSERPVDPQDQHKGNFTLAFRLMCKTIDIIELEEPEDIVPAYEKALNRTDGKSTILVEFSDYQKEK
jgi:pyruvate/2-oxoglutarate/acetoin dehydrogenase E1 component